MVHPPSHPIAHVGHGRHRVVEVRVGCSVAATREHLRAVLAGRGRVCAVRV